MEKSKFAKTPNSPIPFPVPKYLRSAARKLSRKFSEVNEELSNATGFLSQKAKRTEYEIRLTACLQESIVSRSSVRFADVVGLEAAKRALEDSIILPFEHPNFIDRRVTRPKTILLYGEEGTGKTYLAAALASELKNTIVLHISLKNIDPELLAKPDKLLAGMFDYAVRRQPSVLFIDDLESLFDNESQLCSTLKVEFFAHLGNFVKSSQQEGVVVVGAYSKGEIPKSYNSIELFGCFKSKVALQIQNDELAKRDILKIYLRKEANNLSEEDLMVLAKKLKKYSAGHVGRVVKDSLRYPLRAVREATHFKKVQGRLPSDPKTTVDDLYTPCSPNDPDAIEINWTVINEEKLLLPMVTLEHFMHCLGSSN